MRYLLRAWLLSSFFIIFFSFSSAAQDAAHYTCYRTSAPVVIDGRLNEPDWEKAEWSNNFQDITGDPLLKPSLKTRIKLLWDDKYIYLAAEITDTEIWARVQQKDAVIFHDNDFEVFLDLDGNGLNYYEIEVNALGTIWDLMLTRPYSEGGKPLSEWDLSGLKTGVHISGSLNDPLTKDTSWTVEMALPVDELMQGKKPESRPADGLQWRVNFSRVEWKTKIRGSAYIKQTDPLTGKPLPEENWVWSPMGEISMHIPGRWGRLEFSSENIQPEPLKFKNEAQHKGFHIWTWMGGHPDWKVQQWDSVLASLKLAGIYGILTQADSPALKRLLPIAGRYGIRVEKWFVAMMNNESKLIRDHPDWFVVSREGKSSISDPAYVGYYRFLCPSNPEVIQYLKNRLDEYLDIPGLDGIHLDYIRYPDVILPPALWAKYGIIQDREYPPYDYCYCGACRKKFRELSGLDILTLDQPEMNVPWRQFRYGQIGKVVKDLAEYCHRKGKRISAAVFPGPSLAKQLVRQDWEQWPVDEFMPMLYQNFYFGSLDWIRSETCEGVKAAGGDRSLISGLFIPSLSPRELQTAIRKSIEGGASGISLFNYESMTPGHWQALRDCLGTYR